MQVNTNIRKTGISRLIEIAGSKKWLLIMSMSLSIIFTIAQFVPYVAVYKIITHLAEHVNVPTSIDKDFIYYWVYITLASFILFIICLFASIMISHIAAFNILYEIRIKIIRKLVRIPLGFFSKKASGEIKKVTNEDVERIELFVAHHIPDIVSAVLAPLLLISYMVYIDWRLTLIILIIFIIAMFIIFNMMYSTKVKKIYEEYIYALGKMNSTMVEYVRGIQILKTFTNSTESYNQLNNSINAFCDYSIKASQSYVFSYTLFHSLLSAVIVFIAPIGALLLINHQSYQEYLPKMILFLIFGISIFIPTLKLMWMSGFMNQNKIGVAEVDNILYKEEIKETKIPKKIQDASIEFNNVSFSYNDNNNVLKNISFNVKPGSFTALVGPSGSGKSTIALLSLRFWDINEGEIKIGHINIKDIKTSDLMNYVSFVFQDNILFFDTIEENIRMGNSKANFEQIVNAAKIAQCHDFIEKLPNGYRTLVGEGGTYLSGGEAQRVALARVALKNSPILILDEATAFSDPENESEILKAFSHITQNKTVIVIAHRLSTITNANQILYIDKGEILERGTHEELIALNRKYNEMWKIYNTSREWVLKK